MTTNDLLNFPRGTYLILRTDGTVEKIEKKPKILEIDAAMGWFAADTVAVGRAARNDVMMLVDDNGYQVKPMESEGVTHLVPVKALKPINPKATELYHAICVPGTTHQIVGDVVLVHDEDF